MNHMGPFLCAHKCSRTTIPSDGCPANSPVVQPTVITSVQFSSHRWPSRCLSLDNFASATTVSIRLHCWSSINKVMQSNLLAATRLVSFYFSPPPLQIVWSRYYYATCRTQPTPPRIQSILKVIGRATVTRQGTYLHQCIKTRDQMTLHGGPSDKLRNFSSSICDKKTNQIIQPNIRPRNWIGRLSKRTEPFDSPADYSKRTE